MKPVKLSAHQKFKNSMKRAGYDMDAAAQRLKDLLAKHERERQELEKRFTKEELDRFQIDEMSVMQTLSFIKGAHADQLYGKLPYWTHPRSVALTGKRLFGNKFNSDAVKVAFLHDVVEDTDITLEDLLKMDFDPKVVRAVGLLTKDKGLDYAANIDRIISSGDQLAMMVKYADNWENYHGDKSDWDPKRASKSQEKYMKSLNRLGEKLGIKHHVAEAFFKQKPDEQTDTMDLNSMHKHIGAAKMKLIMNHPDFKDHFGTPMMTRTPMGARFRRTNGIERVDVAHAPMGENKFRKMVTFTFGHSGKKISTSEVFHNRNDERHTSVEGKPLMWHHLKTNVHKTDAALDRRLAKMRQQENFQDGRNPQDKGDSVRHGIPKNASLAELEKIRATADPRSRKWVLAHWQINMRRGRAEKTDK